MDVNLRTYTINTRIKERVNCMLKTLYMLLDAIVNIIGGGGRGLYDYLITHSRFFTLTMYMVVM